MLCYTGPFFANLLKAMITYRMYELSYYNPKILHLYSSGCFGLLFFRAISWPLSFWIIIQPLNFILIFLIFNGLLFFRAISWPLWFWIIIQPLNFILIFLIFEIVLAFLKGDFYSNEMKVTYSHEMEQELLILAHDLRTRNQNHQRIINKYSWIGNNRNQNWFPLCIFNKQ